MSDDREPFALDPALLDEMLAWSRHRIADGPDPTYGARDFEELEPLLGGSITAGGLGGAAAFRLFAEVIAPSTRPFDHPMSLSFVAAAPTPAALGFDAALGAAEIFAGNWDGGSGAIHVENQALDWLAGLAGWPSTAGGVFVAGGTMGNLSALHAARTKREADLGRRPARWRMLASAEAHSSIAAAARVLDVDLVSVPADERGRVSGLDIAAALGDPASVFAIVANAGATNCGAIDGLAGAADVAAKHGIWLHVDGAYGLAGLASPQLRPAFEGIERADSFIVDPHKWLFAPYDCCALVYRDPAPAAAAHGQRAAYLEAIDKSAWNPSDFAIHLTRRARGLPLWFSLAVYGTDAYARAIDRVMATTRRIAQGVAEIDGLELLFEPQLSVILFRRPGMTLEEMRAWSETHRRSGAMLCLPTFWRGEPVYRLCLVNPATEAEEVLDVLRTLV